jgi:hypothetical protein
MTILGRQRLATKERQKTGDEGATADSSDSLRNDNKKRAAANATATTTTTENFNCELFLRSVLVIRE